MVWSRSLHPSLWCRRLQHQQLTIHQNHCGIILPFTTERKYRYFSSYSCDQSLTEAFQLSFFDNVQCIGVILPLTDRVTALGDNHPDEVDFIKENNNNVKRFNEFIGGRQALRKAFSRLSTRVDHPIKATLGGGPLLLNQSLYGSISHKDQYAVGVAGIDKNQNTTIGVDIERQSKNDLKYAIEQRVLTPNELSSLDSLRDIQVTQAQEIMLRFSFKEAIYKALHPHVHRYIPFREVEVYPHPDGTATINLMLPETSINNKNTDRQDLTISGQWKSFQGEYWITVVKIEGRLTRHHEKYEEERIHYLKELSQHCNDNSS